MNIIPLPNYYKVKPGGFTINKSFTLNYSKEFAISSQYFLSLIKNKLNIEPTLFSQTKVNFVLNIELHQEGYIINIENNYLLIEAKTDQGAFYAIQSLKQMFVFNNNSLFINSVYIEDYPRFSYRGFMLDVARHFFDKKTVLKIIDYLALHKYNYLHLHLSDDQGFRIQIDKYPLLTEIGSKRTKTKILGGSYNLKPQEGFYTKADLKEIINYARNNFIEIIPEIDLPGHVTSILAAYPKLACSEEKLEVATSFGIKNNVLCPGNKQVYPFITELYQEIFSIFDSKYIHIGTDEVRFHKWKKCKNCKALMKEKNIKNSQDLARYFMNTLLTYLRENKKIPIAWNDLINQNVNYNLILQHWTPFKQKRTIKEINNGRYAIISNFFYLYFDYPYSLTPLKKTYNFNPILKGVKALNNIIGIEAPLWTEWINNTSKLEEHLFPRLAAVSELAWTDEASKDYSNFCIRLKHLLKIYDQNGLNYKLDWEKELSLLQRIKKTYKWYKGK